MRGARPLLLQAYCKIGIIPADAGSTKRSTRPKVRSRDHPRGCGEHARNSILLIPRVGSSPRMRGAHCCLDPAVFGCGIIPADAGSTLYGKVTSRIPKDHPRGCGEHSGLSVVRRKSWGSSPRMRGALVLIAVPPELLGIIPADAGSTCCKSSRLESR